MTTRHYPTTIAVAFEGIGSSTSYSKGLAFCYGATPTHTSNYEFARSLQDAPDSVETSVNPYTGEMSTSSFTFELPATDAIATKLLHVQIRTPLTTTIAFGDSTTAFRATGNGNTALAGDVVYVDDEAILVGTHTGSGVYTGCTRGFWGTTATSHGAGVQVYTSNPFINFRRIVLLEIDRSTGTELVKWRGFVDEVKTDDTGKTIRVSCMELWATVAGAAVNKGAPKLRVSGGIVEGTAFGRPIFIGSARHDGRRVRPSSSSAWYQLGDTLVPATATVSRATFDGPPAYWLGAPVFSTENKYDAGYEVLLVDQSGLGSTDDLAYPYHPLAISMALMVSADGNTASAYDVLGEDWGLAIPESLFDVATIDALIASTAQIKIDRMLLGWDGEPVIVVDTIREKLLRPYGFFLTVTDAGLLSFARLEPTAIDVGLAAEASPVTPIPERLSWEMATDGQFFQAEAMVGEMPWREPDMIVVQRDGSFRDNSRRSLFTRSLKLTYDFSTVAPSSDTTAVLSELMNRVVMGKTAAPIVGITTTRTSTYDLGATIVLSAPDIQHAWWIDRDGTRVTLSSTDASFSGLIIGRRYDFVRGVYDLSLLLLNWSGGEYIRWRAPSAVCVSNASAVVTVQQNAFHAGTDDTSYFEVDDEVYIADKSGAVVEGGFGITAISATTITLSSIPSAAIVAGDIIRLNMLNFTNGAAHLTGTTRPYAAFAVGGVISTASGTVDPDVYG